MPPTHANVAGHFDSDAPLKKKCMNFGFGDSSLPLFFPGFRHHQVVRTGVIIP